MTNTLQVTTPSDREIRMTRVFDAPRGLVFDSWTKPELIKRWLLGPPGWSMPICEIDPRVGGGLRYVWRNHDGRELGIRGVYREFSAPERIVHTELFDADGTGGETLSTTVLTEQGGETTMISTILYASKEARDGALRGGMEQGLTVGYDRLDGVLASRSTRGNA